MSPVPAKPRGGGPPDLPSTPPPSLRGGAGRAWLRRCRGRARSPTPAPAARAARGGELRAGGGARGGAARHVLKWPAAAAQVAGAAGRRGEPAAAPPSPSRPVPPAGAAGDVSGAARAPPARCLPCLRGPLGGRRPRGRRRRRCRDGPGGEAGEAAARHPHDDRGGGSPAERQPGTAARPLGRGGGAATPHDGAAHRRAQAPGAGLRRLHPGAAGRDHGGRAAQRPLRGVRRGRRRTPAGRQQREPAGTRGCRGTCGRCTTT